MATTSSVAGFMPESLQFPGYPADHPMADRLRFKDLTFGCASSDDEVLSPTPPDVLADDLASVVPVFRFLASLAG
jgi:hypothetical protein